MSAGHHKDKSRKASKHARSKKYDKVFEKCITKNSRWRGHKYTISDFRLGRKIDVRPKWRLQKR